MAPKTWWMTPEQMRGYERLSKRLRELGGLLLASRRRLWM